MKILIFDNLKIYRETRLGKLIPCDLASFSSIVHIDVANSLAKSLLGIFKLLSNEHILFKDIYRELEENSIPLHIPINEIWDHPNKKSLIQAHCKSYSIPDSINSQSLYFGYLMMKCKKYVDKNEWQKLFIIKDILITERMPRSIYAQVQKCFTVYYSLILNKTDIIEDNYIIEDYVSMLWRYTSPKKFNLKIKSINRLKREHDELSDKMYENMTPKIKIPKASKFSKLKLSNEFEKISSRRRLIKETTIQKHCVWSYGVDINKDKCAIYSTVYEDKRYTIEFKLLKNKYLINQIQGRFNSEVPIELVEKIQEQLNIINSSLKK